MGSHPSRGTGVRGQWEKYYDQPDRAAGTESGSSMEAYAMDEGKRVT